MVVSYSRLVWFLTILTIFKVQCKSISLNPEASIGDEGQGLREWQQGSLSGDVGPGMAAAVAAINTAFTHADKMFEKKPCDSSECGHRRKRFSFWMPKEAETYLPWNRTNITYSVFIGQSRPDDTKELQQYLLEQSCLEEQVARALAAWAPHCGLNFIKQDFDSKQDINILFIRNDTDPSLYKRLFEEDVLGKTVPSKTEMAVTLNYDLILKDMYIIVNRYYYTDYNDGLRKSFDYLYAIVMHEIGHALGLHHSEVSSAVMFREIFTTDEKTELNEDDIKGMEALYHTYPKFLPTTTISPQSQQTTTTEKYLDETSKSGVIDEPSHPSADEHLVIENTDNITRNGATETGRTHEHDRPSIDGEITGEHTNNITQNGAPETGRTHAHDRPSVDGEIIGEHTNNIARNGALETGGTHEHDRPSVDGEITGEHTNNMTRNGVPETACEKLINTTIRQ